MSLLETAQESLARLMKVEAAREGVVEAQELGALRNELENISLPLKVLAANSATLRKEGVPLSAVSEVRAAIETVKNVATRFGEVPTSTTLKQGTRWTGLTKKLTALATLVSDTRASDWQIFFDSNFFGGARPEARRARLAPTPENEKMLILYSRLFQTYIKYRTQIPKDSADFEVLRCISDDLADIQFQEDVPADVRKFFEATGKGAGLDLVTNEVIEWLRINNLLGSYVVRARI